MTDGSLSDAEDEVPLPGEPLDSGFAYRPASQVPEASLSTDAQARVLAKMDSVDHARLVAARGSRTAYLG